MFLNESHSATIIPTLYLKRPVHAVILIYTTVCAPGWRWLKRHWINIFDYIPQAAECKRAAVQRRGFSFSLSHWEARHAILEYPHAVVFIHGQNPPHALHMLPGGNFTSRLLFCLRLPKKECLPQAQPLALAPPQNSKPNQILSVLPSWNMSNTPTHAVIKTLFFSMCQGVMESKPSGPCMRAWIWLNNSAVWAGWWCCDMVKVVLCKGGGGCIHVWA